MSYRGNMQKLEADADSVVRRYLDGSTTTTGLMAEYRVAHATLAKFLAGRTTAAQRAHVRRRNLGSGGKAGRFKRGHETWNKGRKGLRMSPATEFKPGCLRGQAARRYRHIGSVTIRRDSRGRRYRWLKVQDDGRVQYRCVPYARYVWEQAHGAIPDGCCVVHIDGNGLNDAPGNLRMVSRKLLPRLARLLHPDLEAKRLANLRKTQKKRARNKGARRRMRELRDSRATALYCGGCGYTTEGETPGGCPKCGAGRLEQIQRRARA